MVTGTTALSVKQRDLFFGGLGKKKKKKRATSSVSFESHICLLPF